ncbi:hypothetical protein [Novipirellula sp.]|uniref:hypothetical protein n=1 Tax=Novipirellula sp. TaxID=2795430 RepID=UPI0035645274
MSIGNASIGKSTSKGIGRQRDRTAEKIFRQASVVHDTDDVNRWKVFGRLFSMVLLVSLSYPRRVCKTSQPVTMDSTADTPFFPNATDDLS